MTAEKWKTIDFGFEHTNRGIIQISSNGRLRTFNQISDGNIIKASMVNGYRIMHVKLFKHRDEKTQKHFDKLQRKIRKQEEAIKMEANGAGKRLINAEMKLLQQAKQDLSKKFSEELYSRGVNCHGLVHRLVAEHFLEKPPASHTRVAHLDYNKLNNNVSNLKWMTPEQNFQHQQLSPYVIEAKRNSGENVKYSKLNITKVMQLKKLLNEGETVRKLSHRFNISETQVLRIKRGQNWGEVKAAI